MKHLPNIVSVSRGIAAIGLMFTSTFSVPFWAIYCWCGVSDMIDGPLARRLRAESRTGAVIDSAADLIFAIATFASVQEGIKLKGLSASMNHLLPPIT